VDRYVLQPGDTLARLAAANKITADLLSRINRIADKNLVRAGQTIKIVKGPFDAVVYKSTYTLDVYLGPTLVQSFRVGLGADDGTPEGTWRVSSKLSNPTYYPPRGGRIIAADDPQNPLGERWIGLVGIEGAAVGQERYGIHGTSNPGSIGTASSHGCIRMYNRHVETVFAWVSLGTPAKITGHPRTHFGELPRLIRPGYVGSDVMLLQQRLKELGLYSQRIDGRFGAGTVRALREFQWARFLPVTGIADQATRAALGMP